MDRSTVDGNQVTADGSGNAGGLYLEGLSLEHHVEHHLAQPGLLQRRPVDQHLPGADDQRRRSPTTSRPGATAAACGSGHTPTGTILNCTIADNQSTADGQVAGAIFGDGLTLVNTIIADNTAMYKPSCDTMRPDGSGNLQWPDGSLCTTQPLIADPMLGALGDNGGDTETMAPAAGKPRERTRHRLPADRSARQPALRSLHGRRGRGALTGCDSSPVGEELRYRLRSRATRARGEAARGA